MKLIAVFVLLGIAHLSSSQQCENTLRTKAGAVVSHGYPTEYRHNENCKWNIHPDKATPSYLLLTIHHLSIHKETSGCDHDTLVFSTAEKPDIITACGEEKSVCLKFKILTEKLDKCDETAYNASTCTEVPLDSWPLSIHFKTNAALSKPGFNITYEFPSCAEGTLDYNNIDFSNYNFDNYNFDNYNFGNYNTYDNYYPGLIPLPNGTSPTGQAPPAVATTVGINKGTVTMTTTTAGAMKFGISLALLTISILLHYISALF